MDKGAGAMRRIHRADTAQPAIVDDLRKTGTEVVVIGRPVDLLCRLPQWPLNRWTLVEVKTPKKNGGFRKRLDQTTQTEFCEHHSVPRLTTTEQVMEYLKSL
jgi:hypothetical protein